MSAVVIFLSYLGKCCVGSCSAWFLEVTQKQEINVSFKHITSMRETDFAIKYGHEIDMEKTFRVKLKNGLLSLIFLNQTTHINPLNSKPKLS